MKRLYIHLIAGARPNFMKVAPLYRELKKQKWCKPVLVHTGQHYDEGMSKVFLRDLGLPKPEIALRVCSGSHAQQTARVMIAYEKCCNERRPDWVVVVGDVNSTMACTLVAKKMGISVAHLEAGLRSFDFTMPEEINRVITDSLSDVLWTPSEDADKNLRREGTPYSRIERVGNIIIDSYELLRKKIKLRKIINRFGLISGEFGVVTLHRPANVDNKKAFFSILSAIAKVSELVPLIFPVHPRTASRMNSFGLRTSFFSRRNILESKPLGYIDFMSLVSECRFVITDSGGIQEETTYLGIPCLTLRENTERPVTISLGTNRLVKSDELVATVSNILKGKWHKGKRVDLWDGKTSIRIVKSLKKRARIE